MNSYNTDLSYQPFSKIISPASDFLKKKKSREKRRAREKATDETFDLEEPETVPFDLRDLYQNRMLLNPIYLDEEEEEQEQEEREDENLEGEKKKKKKKISKREKIKQKSEKKNEGSGEDESEEVSYQIPLAQSLIQENDAKPNSLFVEYPHIIHQEEEEEEKKAKEMQDVPSMKIRVITTMKKKNTEDDNTDFTSQPSTHYPNNPRKTGWVNTEDSHFLKIYNEMIDRNQQLAENAKEEVISQYKQIEQKLEQQQKKLIESIQSYKMTDLEGEQKKEEIVYENIDFDPQHTASYEKQEKEIETPKEGESPLMEEENKLVLMENENK
jgi:hypothetical protein